MPGMRVRRIGELRRRIAALEGRGVRPVVADFGDPALDRLLPEGGLGPGLVELSGPAATGFAVALAARALARGGQLVWLAERKRLRRLGFPWPPGLRWLGGCPPSCSGCRVATGFAGRNGTGERFRIRGGILRRAGPGASQSATGCASCPSRGRGPTMSA